MTGDRWRQVSRLYYAALECEASQREPFLREACGDDESLRSEIESLLAQTLCPEADVPVS